MVAGGVMVRGGDSFAARLGESRGDRRGEDVVVEEVEGESIGGRVAMRGVD